MPALMAASILTVAACLATAFVAFAINRPFDGVAILALGLILAWQTVGE